MEDITHNDLIKYITRVIKEQGLVSHNIESFNQFITKGINSIIVNQFQIDSGKLPHRTTNSPIDSKIAYYRFIVNFTKTELTEPTLMLSNKSEIPLFPNHARLENANYCAKLYVDAVIRAQAYDENGQLMMNKERVTEVKDCYVSAIPIMVRSNICRTYNLDRKTLFQIQEDPLDEGGYFIMKGNEWIINSRESIAFNLFHVYNNNYKKELTRGEFISKPGDSFENSHEVIIRYKTNGGITLSIAIKGFRKLQIPFYIFYRLYDVSSDREITETIVHDLNDTSPITETLKAILSDAFKADEPEFKPLRPFINNKLLLLAGLHRLVQGEKLPSTISEETMGISSITKKDETAFRVQYNDLIDTLDSKFLPHISIEESTRREKMRFLGGCLLRKLLLVAKGYLPQTDRDSYRNKRIFLPGVSYSNLLKMIFNLGVVQPERSLMKKEFDNHDFSTVKEAVVFQAVLAKSELEKSLSKSITTGSEKISIKRREVSNKLFSQNMERKNQLNVLAAMRAVETPNSKQTRQTERAFAMRSVQSSYCGIICPIASADTGDKVGLSKQMACTIKITNPGSSDILKTILRDDNLLSRIENLSNQMILSRTKVFVNGDWIGCLHDPWTFVRKYRYKRRRGEIERKTTIYYDILTNELYFWVDYGRVIRPLLIVNNNLSELIKNPSIGFKQYLAITKKHIDDFVNGTITLDDLVEQQLVEYISAEESENCLIAESIDILQKNRNDYTYTYTHCDIPQAIMGITALTCPYANHTFPGKMLYQTNQSKQTCGWFALSYPYRTDRNAFLQNYCERPLVSTITNDMIYPIGSNIVVAMNCYSGYNQEDSMLYNKASLDRGLFAGSHYYYEISQLEPDEEFKKPETGITRDLKSEANYSKLDSNGFIPVDTVIYYNDIIIGKVSKTIDNDTGAVVYIDRSVIYQKYEPAIIERVMKYENSISKMVCKVKMRSYRKLETGDKSSSRSGNKGINAVKFQQSDMPYTENGLIPDIILNPHCIPTRMILGQIIESVFAKIAALRGITVDGTSFTKIDLEAAARELKHFGFDEYCEEVMYNGQTGNRMDSKIFISMNYYQRLKKFVIDDAHSSSSGPTNALTRQPIEGSSRHGGYKLGEMEAWCINSHGSMRCLMQKMFVDSDGFDIYVCRCCGRRAIYNKREGLQRCKLCEANAEIVKVHSSWSSNLFMNELTAMGIEPVYKLEPFTFNE